MSTVALIDYGSGNLRSAEKALQKAASSMRHAPTVVTTDEPDVIAGADRVVLPGVGAFAHCMSLVTGRPGVVEAMTQAVREKGRPFFGICVGMQLMASRGLEFGETAGLGWIEGDVKRIEPADPHLKIPHMGWNSLDGTAGKGMFAALPAGTHVYFTHSFALYPANDADVAAWTDHGGPICAAVTRDNLAGAQFHPEKSQAAGQTLLRSFLEWAP